MIESFEKIKEQFPKLKIEEIEQKYLIKDELEIHHHLFVSGLQGNTDLTLIIRDEEEANSVLSIPFEDLFLFKDILGLFYNKKVEIVLTEVGFRSFLNDKLFETSGIDIKTNYKKQELNIKIQIVQEDIPIKFIANHIRGSFRGRFRRITLLTIENISNLNIEDLENETKSIINSVLFDLDYNFNLAFEVVNINSFLRRMRKRPKARYELPTSPIELTYKKYIPELIDYFHTGDKVDYLPFKYVCYFHIIEYFQDKSAFFVVREKLKHLIQKPDFSLNINFYTTQALNLIKQESEKHQTDKIKIQKVFKQFIELDELKQFLSDEELLDVFTKDCSMACSKPLILQAIDFSSDARFYETLTNRIYSMRCSIVHSNPDFDDKKAVPFIASIDNVEKLRFEVDLIMELAKNIILKSIE